MKNNDETIMKIKRYQWFKKMDNFGAMSKVSSINILLAVIALLKDMFLASYLGTTAEADAILLAFFITDMVGSNLLANGVLTGCIPIFSSLYMSEKQTIHHSYIKQMNRYLLLITGGLATFLYLFRVPLIEMMANGFTGDVKLITTRLFIIMLPTVIIYPATYIGIAALQIKGKFAAAALSPVLFNGVFLIGTIVCLIRETPREIGVFVIGWLVLLSVIAMLLWTYFCLLKGVYRDANDRKMIKSKPIVFDFNKLFWPYLSILFLTQGIMCVERFIASSYGVGGVSALNYAYRLSQFPIWVFVAAIGTVAFPSMSKNHGIGETEASLNTLKKSVWLMLIVTIPATLLLFILREPVISVLFQRQAFNEKSVQLTAMIVASYTFAILGQSITLLCLKYFISMRRVREPIAIFLATGLLNITIDFLLVDKIGLVAFGYGAAVAGTLNAVFLLSRMNLNLIHNIVRIRKRLLKLMMANIAPSLVCLGFYFLWENRATNMAFAWRFALVATAFILYGLLYLAGILKLGLMKEYQNA